MNPEIAIDGLYIDGAWSPAAEGETDEVRSPYDNRLVALVPRGGVRDVERAVAAAERVSREGLPRHERIGILGRAAQLLEERSDEFALAIALECAKPIKTARGEVNRAIDTIRFSAAEAMTSATELVPMDAVAAGAGKFGYTVRTPVGVIAAIAPFNFPLNLVMHKVAPAIAVGCAVVVKPASQTPVSALLVARLFEDAGLPAGWLNVVTGGGAVVGTALAAHPAVRYVTFTGSPEVGWGIAAAVPRKRVRLELGSNAPLIVDADSAWEVAAAAAGEGGFVQAGQSCVSTQRIFVVDSIFDAFTERLVERVSALCIGDPLDENIDVSSVIHIREAERIESWINAAAAGGANVRIGGTREGTLVLPTVLTDVSAGMSVQCEEVFGPVVTVTRVADVSDGLAQANDSRFGLNAGVFTNDIATAMEAIARLDFGSVYINDVPTVRVDLQPYGGMKESGNTREGPRYAMEEMTELKFVTIRPLPRR